MDKEERIQQFVTELDDIFDDAGSGGLVTMEKVQVLAYRPG